MKAYTFTKTKDETNRFDQYNVEIRVDDHDSNVTRLLKAFKGFLLACGFQPEVVNRITLADE